MALETIHVVYVRLEILSDKKTHKNIPRYVIGHILCQCIINRCPVWGLRESGRLTAIKETFGGTISVVQCELYMLTRLKPSRVDYVFCVSLIVNIIHRYVHYSCHALSVAYPITGSA